MVGPYPSSSGLRKACLCLFVCHKNCLLWTIPSIPSISFFHFVRRVLCSESERFCFVFPLFVHNPSAFRREVPSKLPRSPPKPRNVPRSPFTLRRRSCPVAQAPFSTRGLREAEEQALPGRAWSPRSVRATSPFGLARRGKEDATDPVKMKGFSRRRTTLSNKPLIYSCGRKLATGV